jgi:hypothetical protein
MLRLCVCIIHVLVGVLSSFRFRFASLSNSFLQFLHGSKEPVYDFILVVDLRFIDRIVARSVDDRDIGTGVNEKFYAFEMTIQRGPVEGCVACFIDRVEECGFGLLSAGREQQLDDVYARN